MSNDLDIPAIVRAAGAATPGPWHAESARHGEPRSLIYKTGGMRRQIARTMRVSDSRDADFIAAAHPQAVLAMARRIEELESFHADEKSWRIDAEHDLATLASKVEALVTMCAPGSDSREEERLRYEHAEDVERGMLQLLKRAEQAEQRAREAERLAVALHRTVALHSSRCGVCGRLVDFEPRCEHEQLIDAIRARVAGEVAGSQVERAPSWLTPSVAAAVGRLLAIPKVELRIAALCGAEDETAKALTSLLEALAGERP